MNYSQINPIVQLFSAIVRLEDDITPSTDVTSEESNASKLAAKLGQLKQLAREKRALVKRTHPCTLSLFTENRAKPLQFKAGEVWSLSVNEQATVLQIITCATDPSDPAVARPTGLVSVPIASVQEAHISDAADAAMAAVSNSLAENPSQAARDIVAMLSLQDVVKAAKAEQQTNPTTGDGPAILWFPVAGWSGVSAEGVPQSQPFMSSFALPPVLPNS